MQPLDLYIVIYEIQIGYYVLQYRICKQAFKALHELLTDFQFTQLL